MILKYKYSLMRDKFDSKICKNLIEALDECINIWDNSNKCIYLTNQWYNSNCDIKYDGRHLRVTYIKKSK